MNKGALIINSQQRILDIARRLLLGERLTKKQLMEEYDKSASGIQRDISYISEMLTNELNYDHNLLTTGPGKGEYHLEQHYLSNTLNQLTDLEIFSIAAILSNSRGLENTEFHQIFDKVISLSENKKQLKEYFANELLEYRGTPDEAILGKIAFILNAIKHHRGIEFTYTKNGRSITYQRTPFSIFFSDLYFFVATDMQTSLDDTDLEQLNKFRINSMENLKEIPCNKKLDYASRFKVGEFRKSTWIPFYGNEMNLIIDFYYDPIYVLNRFPNSKIIEEKEDCVRISIQANDGWGVKMWLLSQGPTVKVISPKKMVNFIINNLNQTLNRYQEK